MSKAALITMIYLSRITMSLIVGLLLLMWNLGIDYAIYGTLTVFLLSMFCAYEYTDYDMFAIMRYLYSALFLCLLFSCIWLGVFNGFEKLLLK